MSSLALSGVGVLWMTGVVVMTVVTSPEHSHELKRAF